MNNLSFEEFKQEIANQIKEFLPESYQDAHVQLQEIVKNNDTKLSALTITSPESNISPTIYLNNFYEQYQDGASMESIMVKLAAVRVEHEVEQSFDVSRITEFDQVKDKIAARIVGAEMNEELLSKRPHTMVDDLAVTYCVMLQENEQGAASVPITNELLATYGISLEELHETAIKNMDSLTPGSFKSMGQVMKEMMLPNMIAECGGNAELAQEMFEAMCPPDDGKMYVLTNEQKLNGAAVVLNDKFMDQVAEKVGDQFYILPSSIHECLVVPKDAGIGRNELEQMVQEVNATQVAPEERLSDHVYAYDAVDHELYRADREEARTADKEAEKSAVSKSEPEKDNSKEKAGDEKAAGEKSVGERSSEKKTAEKKPRASVKEKLASKQKECAERDAKAVSKQVSKKKDQVLA